MCLGEKRFRAEKNQSLWIWVSQLCGIVRYISIIFIHLVLKFTSLQGVYFGFQKTILNFFFYSFLHYLRRSEEELLCDLAKFQSHFMSKRKWIFHSSDSLEPYISPGTIHMNGKTPAWIVCVHVKIGDMKFELWLEFELLLNGVLLLGGEDWNKILSTNEEYNRKENWIILQICTFGYLYAIDRSQKNLALNACAAHYKTTCLIVLTIISITSRSQT